MPDRSQNQARAGAGGAEPHGGRNLRQLYHLRDEANRDASAPLFYRLCLYSAVHCNACAFDWTARPAADHGVTRHGSGTLSQLHSGYCRSRVLGADIAWFHADPQAATA